MKTAIKSLLLTTTGWGLASFLRSPGTLVLMYHRVGPNSEDFASLDLTQFRGQMTWLKEHCTVIGPEEVRESVTRSRRARPSVLVTFDDGYRDYHDHAYPILKDLRIPALVFLSTVFMDEPGRLLWPDLLHLAAHRARPDLVRLPWESGPEIDLAAPEGRRRLVRAAKDHVKEIPEEAKAATLERLFSCLGFDPVEQRVERQMLSWDEVRATQDLTTYGGHTHTHPILSQIGREEAYGEIRTCRDRLVAETGRTPRHFAYPNGRARDFNEDTKAALRSTGFEVAYATEEGTNDLATDWMAVRRIPAAASMPEFAWALATPRAS